MLAAGDVAVLIERHVKEKIPFCLIRLGDGEGNLLNLAQPRAEDFGYFKEHFGDGVREETIIEIRNNLTAAIGTADLIGVRDDVWQAPSSARFLNENDDDFLEKFCMQFPLRAAERSIDPYGAKRLFRLFKWIGTSLPAAAAVCSQWICYDLARLGFWERLIVGCGSVSLIHCSPTLPGKVRRELDVEVESILVPDKAVQQAQWRDYDAALGRSVHYPDEFVNVCDRLRGQWNGRVFLVGAGLVGKKYLQVIKENGGIALDVGALLDAWDGRATRNILYRHKFATWIPGPVPPRELRLDKRRARVEWGET